MAQPFPAQGEQKQYTEKPVKIYGEQYLEGEPVPVGAVINDELFNDGLLRVMLPYGWVVVNLTDWVITSRYSGQPVDVMSADEFDERYGNSGGGPQIDPTT